MHFVREIRLRRVKCLRAWVDLFHFTLRSEMKQYFTICEADYFTFAKDTRQRLNSYLPHYNAALADSAEDFHDSLYINGEHITSYVNTYYIAGYGKQTVDIIEFNMWDWYIYEYTYDGDQMVAEWSATLGDRYSNKTFFAEDVSHVGLVANSNVKH